MWHSFSRVEQTDRVDDLFYMRGLPCDACRIFAHQVRIDDAV
jgi:hypothetical protein